MGRNRGNGSSFASAVSDDFLLGQDGLGIQFETLEQVYEELQKLFTDNRYLAEKEQKVQFVYPDQEPFKRACMPLHESVLKKNKALRPIYDKIQEYNKNYPAVTE